MNRWAGIGLSSSQQTQLSDEMTTMQIDDCSICFDRWRCEGVHQICCLPCGHLFGFSCIIRWLQQSGVVAQCPTCRMPFREPDVRKIYGSPVVVDPDLLDTNQRLKEENELLTQEVNIHRASPVNNAKIKTE